MWIKNNFFKYSAATISVLLIIFLVGQIDFFIEPFKSFILIIFFPLLISGFLYYLFRPLVRLFLKLKVPNVISILIVFAFFIGLFSFITVYASSIFGEQMDGLIRDLPTISQNVITYLNGLIKDQNLYALFGTKIEQQITSSVQTIIPNLGNWVFSLFSALTSFASILLVVPFILFFMLKDDTMFLMNIRKRVHGKYSCEIDRIIKETDKTLSSYIIGQAIIALILGLLTYISFAIIGLKYAAILSLFVMLTSFIPIIGVIIGIVPAVFVGLSMFSTSPYIVFQILILTLIIQQLVGNFVFPNLIGRQMNIHPLTIIIIFLGAAALFGFIGVLIIIPVYAVLKILVVGAFKIYKIWRSKT